MPKPAKKPAAPPLSNLRLVRYTPGWGHTPAEYAKALDAGEAVPLKVTAHPATIQPFVSVYRTTLAMPSSSKRAGEPDSVEVVVKINPLPNIGKRVQSLFRRTKHHRQWAGYEVLTSAEILASKPLAILIAQTTGAHAEVLILEHTRGKTLLEHFANHQDGCPLPNLIAPQLGSVIVSFERNGLWNRDPKPSNIVIRSQSGETRCVLIDTVGIERRASRDHGFLKHFLGLLMLETRGTGVACPPQFSVDLATSVLRLNQPKRSPPSDAEMASRVDALLESVQRSITDRDPTPTDSPLPPTS